MTTADVDQLFDYLEENPADQEARLALSDALREAGSPLADGVAALAACGRVPRHVGGSLWHWIVIGDEASDHTTQSLPADWFAAAFAASADMGGRPDVPPQARWRWGWEGGDRTRTAAVVCRSGRLLQEVAAEAFLELPAARQQQLKEGILWHGTRRRSTSTT